MAESTLPGFMFGNLSGLATSSARNCDAGTEDQSEEKMLHKT